MALNLQNLGNRLTFRQLQVFQAVYDLRSYSRAGELLGLTQPAVSSQIRQLEQALGLPLFEYVGRRLYCTPVGEKLAESTHTIFDALRELHSDLAEQQGQVAGELKLVVVNTAQYVAPYLLRAFLNLYPQVKVGVRVVNRAAALQTLSENSDDLVIMGLVPGDRSLASIPFLNNELVPVVPEGHPLLQSSPPSVQSFLDSNLLLRENGSGSRLALELHCQQQRLQIQTGLVLGSNDAVKHAVIAGLGVAVLPRLGILPELKLGLLRVLDLPGFPLRRSWCLVYSQGKQPMPAMRAFIDYVQQNIGQFEHLFARLSQGA